MPGPRSFPLAEIVTNGPGAADLTAPCTLVYHSYMATRTITLELDAYDRLRRARRSPRESFSSVVRRATWSEEPMTARRLLEQMRAVGSDPRNAIDEETLDRLDRAQAEPRVSRSHWAD